MTSLELTWLVQPFRFPATAAPAWSARVERWHQLDAQAYGVADAIYAWMEPYTRRPALVILASPGSSNETDWLFAQTQGTSPSLFAHSLPSSRGSACCQVMNWTGPLLCIQADPNTCATALREACELIDDACPVVWIISIERDRTRGGPSAAHLFAVQREPVGAAFALVRHDSASRCADDAAVSDADLFAWLAEDDQGRTEVPLLSGYAVRRKSRPAP